MDAFSFGMRERWLDELLHMHYMNKQKGRKTGWRGKENSSINIMKMIIKGEEKRKNRVDRIKLHNVETQKTVLNDIKYERKKLEKQKTKRREKSTNNYILRTKKTKSVQY